METRMKLLSMIGSFFLIAQPVQAQGIRTTYQDSTRGWKARSVAGQSCDFVSQELAYNDATVTLQDGRSVTGLYAGLNGYCVCLMVEGKVTQLSLTQIREFTIVVERKPWKAAMTGMALADYLGNLFVYKREPFGYPPDTKQGFDVSDLGFMVLGASVGYLLNPQFPGGEKFYTEENGDEDSVRIRSRFVEFLLGDWYSCWHFSVEGGYVNTREHQSTTYGFSTARTLNFFRRIEFVYSVSDFLRCGVEMVFVKEPSFWVSTGSWSDYTSQRESFSTGTLYAALVEIAPPRRFVPSQIDIAAGFGLGLMNINYERRIWTYRYAYGIFESAQTISKSNPGGSIFVKGGVYVHPGLSVSLTYDYTFAFGQKFPDFPEAGLHESDLGNSCLGFTLGLHF